MDTLGSAKSVLGILIFSLCTKGYFGTSTKYVDYTGVHFNRFHRIRFHRIRYQFLQGIMLMYLFLFRLTGILALC